jgi:membrane-bound inhibitor of C-type lysozyme
MRIAKFHPALVLLATFPLFLAGCGGFSIWPFGKGGEQAQSSVPPNAVQYRCDAGKSFYLNFLDTGAAWISLPERQFRLDKLTAEPGSHYSNGIATLEITGNEASLTDGPPNTYSACKAASGKQGG